jgi:hypothetical protein
MTLLQHQSYKVGSGKYNYPADLDLNNTTELLTEIPQNIYKVGHHNYT